MRPRRERRAVVALVIGASAVAAAWGLAGPSTPPLYDTIQPAAPYLYYCVPAGYSQSRAPRPVTMSQPVAGGKLTGEVLAVSTDEPPVSQVQILVGGDTLNLPAGATEVTGTITPVTDPSIPPADGTIDGSAYTVSVTSGGRPLTMQSGQFWTIVLRGPAGKGTAVPEEFDGTSWQHAALVQPVGQPDAWAANFSTFGTFALVLPGPAGTPQPCHPFQASASGTGTGPDGTAHEGTAGASGTPLVPILAAAAALIAIAGAGYVVRSRRTPGDPF